MKFSSEKPKILVVGSCSIDIILKTDHIPHEDETVMATSTESFFGGKGANQAVAAARLGCSVSFVGSVGIDPYGQQIMRNLVSEGINVGFLTESDDLDTGTAYVTSSEESKNAIVVFPAANFGLTANDVREAEKLFSTTDAVLVQLEIPLDAVTETVRLAKKYGKKIGIYASPANSLTEEIISSVNFMVAKEKEIFKIFGTDNQEELLKKYPLKLFLRDLDNGTIYYDGAQIRTVKSAENHQHKMGMGDAFTAGLCVALCHNNNIEDAVVFGAEMAAKVACEKGSQKGLPKLSEL